VCLVVLFPSNDANLSLKVRDPGNNTIEEKPAELNFYSNAPRSRNPGRPIAQTQAQAPPHNPGFPYGYYPPPYPPPYPPTWHGYSQGPPSTLNPAGAPIIKVNYPMIIPWLNYCDKHPERCGEDFSAHADKFNKEGYRRLHQLTGDRVSVEKLSDWLGIGKGTADLLIRYAEEDLELVKAGTFTMTVEEDLYA
jgi:hypothetical protein